MDNKIQFSDEELMILNKYTNSKDITDILNKFGGDIDKLKSYVKWLYKYGGTGSKGNGGNGSSTTDNWTILCTFDGDLVTDNKTILLNKSNNNKYQLRLSIGRPGDASYTIELIQNKKKIDSKKISAENNEYVYNVQDTSNGTIIINVKNNDTDLPKSISFDYILNPHILTYDLIDDSDNTNIKSLLNNDAIYITETHALKLKLNHNIYVDAKNIKIQTNLIGLHNYTIDDIILNDNGINDSTGNNESYIDLYDIIGLNNYVDINDIVSTYNLTCSLTYNYNNKPVIETFNLSFTLIPEGLYLKVLPKIKNSIIYHEQQNKEDDITYKFSSKNVIFNITGYDSSASNLMFRVEENGQNIINTTTIYHQQPQQFTIQLNNNIEEITEHKLKFIISNGLQSNEYIYYVYIDKENSDLLWIDSDINILRENYFIGNNLYNKNSIQNISLNTLQSLNDNFGAQGYINMNIINNENGVKIYEETNNSFTTSNADLLISFGIQYNEVNDDNSNLMRLLFNLGNNVNQTITVKQNSIIIGSDQKLNIFIPKEINFDASNGSKYHIVNFLIRNTKNNIDEQYAYEFIVYIDGYIEAALKTYFTTTSLVKLANIYVYESNYSINLLDIKYLQNKSDNNDLRQINDSDIVQYYYKYNLTLNHPNYQLITEEEINYFKQIKDIFVFFKDVDFYNDKNEITTSVIKINGCNNEDELIKKLTSNNTLHIDHKIPFLILNMNIKGQFNSHQAFFENFLNKSIAQTDFDKLQSISIPKFTIINEDGIVHQHNKSNSIFNLQGSSTGRFKSKNFTLSVTPPSNQVGKVALFTPNFIASNSSNDNDAAYMTFLPEAMFTFKADVVDSTHSNNTSAGLFINKNTTKFADSRNVHENASSYIKYVKNCLTGFPILTIFGLIDTDDLGNEVTTYYYMGIYNCNLGRDSYLNLGYYQIGKILNNLEDLDGNKINILDGNHNGFGVYMVDSEHYQPTSNLCVAEIQGGNSWYDFSQFGDTVLFGDSNGEGMFGDFYPKVGNFDNQKQKIKTFVKSIATVGGGIFSTLKKYMSEDPSDNYGYDKSYNEGYYIDSSNEHHYTESINSVPNFKHQFKRSSNGKDFIIDDELTNQYRILLNNRDMSDISNWSDIFIDLIGIKTDSENAYIPNEYSNENNNENKWFYLLDYTSLVEYYTICMAFGLVDSVMKNLNIKSFKVNGPFYIAFYDMDTSFGRDNSGEYVDPFAFSDYWQNNLDENDNNTNIIYRDFYPNRELPNKAGDMGITLNKVYDIPVGYDIPSSYLFAIAKYAKHLIKENRLDRYQTNPNYFWYTLRYDNTRPLANAKSFINKYFGLNLNKVNRLFFNANYRYKYLQKTSTGFDDTNISPFHGRGLYSLEDWLNKRFHILDAYFNIKQISGNNCNNIQKYNLTTNKWEDLTIGGVLVYDPLFSEVSGQNDMTLANSDIYLTQSIFQSSDMGGRIEIQGQSLNKIYIKTLDYSAMSFNYQENSGDQFICIKSDQEYVYSEPPGLQGKIAWYFGGSIAWTHVRSFNTLIPSSKTLTLNAPYLEDIIVTIGELNNINLMYVPSIRNIQITSDRAICSLNLQNNPGEDKYPNLRNVDLHNSKCSLIVNNVNIAYINVNNINSPSSDMIISNCANLKSFDVNNAKLQSLEISSLWDKNIEIRDTQIKSITIINSKYTDDTSIKISNDNILESLTLQGFSNIIVENCYNLKNINIQEYGENNIILSPLKSLQIKNSCNNDNVINNVIFNGKNIKNEGIVLTNFNNLESISFESTTGFNKIILPANKYDDNGNEIEHDIELLPKAFYDTDLQYIDFADKHNDKHHLILCDTNNGNNSDCSIFYNSAFMLCSSYDYSLNFSVKEQNTSLKSIFEISKNQTSLGIHNGVANITYNRAQEFINGLTNKEYVIELERAFFRQTKIEASYDGEKFKSGDNNLSNDKLITLNGYNGLNNISYMFEYTNIEFIDKNFFNNCCNDVDIINIDNFMDYNSLHYIHFNAFNNIKNKIYRFLFFGKNDNSIERFCNNIRIFNDRGIIDEVNVHEFLFNDEQSKLTELCGFNLSNKYDFENLFTINEVSINSIHDIFTNLNQSNNSNVININSLSLAKLSNLTELKNAFSSISNVSINDVNYNNTIDMLHYLDWQHNQYLNIKQTYRDSNIFNFYKNVNLTTNENKKLWMHIWNSLYSNSNDVINYVFNKSLFNVNNDYKLKIPAIDEVINETQSTTIEENNISSAKGLFANSLFYIDNNKKGIKLADDALQSLTKLTFANNMFNGCTFDSKDNKYPLSNTLFNNLNNLKDITGIFANTNIEDTCCKTYKDENEAKQVYYKISIANGGHNYEIISSGTNSSYDNGIGYPFIPEDLFTYNTNLETIENAFSNSDFEGYLPSTLFTNNKKLRNIDNFIYNCKILPQLYKTFNNNDVLNIYDNTYSSDDTFSAYVFIPEDLFTNDHNLFSVANIFNFKLLISDDRLSRLYLMTNNSLGSKSGSKSPGIIDLVISNDSFIIDSYIKNESTNDYNLQTLNYCGYINLSINDDGENKYSEGIDLNTFIKSNTYDTYLINETLSTKYYGYIFKPQTLIIDNNQYRTLNFYRTYFIKTNLQKQNPSTSTDSYVYKPSQYIIWPSIIIHNNVEYSNMPTSFIKRKYSELSNITKIKSLYLTLSNNIINIKDNMIDTTILDDDTLFKEPIENNNEYIYSFEYNSFKCQKTYENNNSLNNFKDYLRQIIYNNYYLLFNDWYKETPAANGKAGLHPYSIEIKNNDNNLIKLTQFTNIENYMEEHYTIDVVQNENKEYIIQNIDIA